MIASPARVPNGNAFDIAGKGFGEGNVKLGRSPGVRKDEKLWWLPSHAATIQPPTRAPRHGATEPARPRRVNPVQVINRTTCEKTKRSLGCFASYRFIDSPIAERKKALRFPRHQVWLSV